MDFSQFYQLNSFNSDSPSDKGTTHDYIDGYYSDVFTPVKDKEINLLEIGIFKGQSLRLFKEWFTNGQIFGVDDGPHTLESQMWALMNWSKKLKPGGKLIIEDIQSINHVVYLERIVDINLFTFNSFDLRANKNRYDDIIFEVTKK